MSGKRAAAVATQRPYGAPGGSDVRPVARLSLGFDDKVRLTAAVQLCGMDWVKVRQLLVKLPAFANANTGNLRSQWRRDRNVATVQAAAQEMIQRGELEESTGIQPQGRPPRQGCSTGRKRRRPHNWSSESSASESEELPPIASCGLAGAPASFLGLHQMDVSKRRICTGRGWSRAVAKAVAEPCALTRRAQECVELWALDECKMGQRMMACHVRRARSRVKKYIADEGLALEVKQLKLTVQKRDELRLVFYPGDILPTFLGKHDNVLLLSGPDIGAPRFITAVEVARLMGHPVGPTSPFGIASRLVREQRLYELVCDSIHTLFGAQLVHDAWSRAGWGGATSVRYGSLMGSGLDGFYAPVKAASGLVRYCMQADISSGRAAMLLAAHGVEVSFGSAALAAEMFAGELDVLTMTAPCKLLSQMQHLRPEEAAAVEKRAEEETQPLVPDHE